MAKTIDGLPIVSEETFMKFVKEYPFTSEKNDPEITERIKKENPQIYRLMEIGMNSAPNNEARVYFECAFQITYELLRKQNQVDSKD